MISTLARVAVLGSINMDLVIACEHLVQPGETILAQTAKESPGGKGANQAVGAARLGARVAMLGRVGDDAFSSTLLAHLRDEGVQTDAVIHSRGIASGLAVVAVEASGENAIMVVPGANGRVCEADINAFAAGFAGSDTLLLQLEIPVATVAAAIACAHRIGLRVILDPAPAPAVLPADCYEVDLLVPNAAEAATLLGLPAVTRATASEAAAQLIARGARHVIITLGDEGAMVHDGTRCEWIPPVPVTAVDTTAAGDAFAAAIAVFWRGETSLFDAARTAAAAGALAASRPGAQLAMPRAAELARWQ